jgi:hypothetical protein
MLMVTQWAISPALAVMVVAPAVNPALKALEDEAGRRARPRRLGQMVIPVTRSELRCRL